MPRYSAPRRDSPLPCTAAPVQRTGANLSPTSMCCPPAREPPSAVLHEQGCHPEAGKTETTRFAGRGPAADLLQAAASGAGLHWDRPRRRARAANRGDLPARHLHTAHARTGCGPRPARQTVLRPTAATPSAVPCPPGHMPPSAFIAGTSPRRSPRSARCGPVTPTGRDLRHAGGYRTMAAASGRHAARLLFQSRRILLAESEHSLPSRMIARRIPHKRSREGLNSTNQSHGMGWRAAAACNLLAAGAVQDRFELPVVRRTLPGFDSWGSGLVGD